jgi:hypothetical protein
MAAPSTPLGAPLSPREARSKTPATEARKRVPARKPERPEGSSDAKRAAAAILEVLAGVRTTTDAAKELSVSLPRYYQLEARAIAGLVHALEPRPRGPTRSPDREMAKLQKEISRLERELARAQALARTAQRTLGLAPAPAKVPKKDGGGKHCTRRPVARALRAAKALREAEAKVAPPAPAATGASS